MRTPVTLLAFFVGLLVLFGVAVSLGEMVGGGAPVSSGGSGSGENDAGAGDATEQNPDRPGGLAVADQGYVLFPELTRFQPGIIDDFRFSIFTIDRTPVTDFAVNQERRMHLILVRRDLTNYQHLHPTMKPDGTWSVSLRIPEPGSYRAFATFQPDAVPEPITLGVDLEVPGLVKSGPVAHPVELARVDDYSVMLEGTVLAGGVSRLYFNVQRDTEQVTDLEPYLGAIGHLVLLREGDLAYLHVHPVTGTGPGAGPTITFDARVPTPGYYRAFLDFQHRGEVRTAEFTILAS